MWKQDAAMIWSSRKPIIPTDDRAAMFFGQLPSHAPPALSGAREVLEARERNHQCFRTASVQAPSCFELHGKLIRHEG